MKNRLIFKSEMVILRLLKWRWWIAGLFVVGLITLEFLEHDSWGVNIFLDLEFIMFFSTVFIAGILFELLARSNRKLESALKILDYKHKFILELAQEEDWDTLTTRLVQFPKVIADVVESALIFYHSDLGANEFIARWVMDGLDYEIETGELQCETCFDSKANGLHLFKSHQDSLPEAESENRGLYCLPISNGNTMMATLRFKMAEGIKPRLEQITILNNVIDEMSISLKASQDRKLQADMRVAEANLIQHKDIWRDLHDHLGQNLAYLRLKMDQFSKPGSLPPLSEIRTDLIHMRDVANESYLIVRNWLENRHPETQSQLANLMLAHGREIAKRGNFEINISNEGLPLQIDPSMQRKIFYVFREALSNIAKHAEASKVEVILAWGPADLTLTISDNGKGFDPQQIDTTKHFGFGIMNERVSELQGRLELNTSVKLGTVISIWVPAQ